MKIKTIWNFGRKLEIRKKLFTDSVSVNKKYLTDTLSVNKKYLTDSGVPIEKNTLREEVYYMVVSYRPLPSSYS